MGSDDLNIGRVISGKKAFTSKEDRYEKEELGYKWLKAKNNEMTVKRNNQPHKTEYLLVIFMDSLCCSHKHATLYVTI